MSSPAYPIDSALLPSDLVPTTDPLASTVFAVHDRERLRDFLEYLASLPGDNLASRVASLSEPGLYTLVAALAVAGESAAGSRIKSDYAAVVPGLLAEMRRRNCRGMGDDPTGPARRGRLLQLAGTFTTLSPAGNSPLQEHKLAGSCPFCGGDPSFQVYLPRVRWQCFGCSRRGGLLEFAECLLESLGRPDAAGDQFPPVAHTR